MVVGIERLRRAREILDQSGQEPTDPQSLADAAGECWSAAIDAAVWPIELRVRAAAVQELMFRYGTIRTTVDRMSDAERAELGREILDLAATAERLVANG